MRLKDLAAALELSPTTVSRALGGYPEVSEATRRRVQEAAERLGYRPDGRAQGLATGRSRAIGHVIAAGDRHEMVNPVFADFVAGAGIAYAAQGYEMLMKVVPDAAEERAYRDLALARKVDGFIVHAPKVDDRRIDLLSELGLPFVVHGRASAATRGYSWVDVNNVSALRRATRHLIDLGHRRIGFLNGVETQDFAVRRRRGYEAALAEAGLPVDPELMRAAEMTEGYGYREASALLSRMPAPTAIVTASLIVAMGARRAIEEAGAVLGRDVSVLTFDDELSYLGAPGVPVFSGARSSVREAGRLCAQMLLALVDDPASGPRTHLLEAELTLGTSTGPPASRSLDPVAHAG